MELTKIFPKWLEEDKRCAQCGAITERVRGITKQNMIRMVKPKWDATELMITFILIAFVIMGVVYKAETQQAKDLVDTFNRNPGLYCDAYYNMVAETTEANSTDSTPKSDKSGFQSINLSVIPALASANNEN